MKQAVNRFLVGTLFCLFSLPVLAIEIDGMFKVSGANDSATYKITNSGDSRIYLNAVVQELEVDGKTINKIHYDRNNLEQWKATVTPSQMVLGPGFEGRFQVQYDCEKCDPDTERVFQISFIPSPYFENGKEEQHRVGVSVGFAALFVKYSGVDDINYAASLDGQDMTIINHGQSFIQVGVQYCNSNDAPSQVKKCDMEVSVLAGRELTFKLPLLAEVVRLDIKSAKKQIEKSALVRNRSPQGRKPNGGRL